MLGDPLFKACIFGVLSCLSHAKSGSKILSKDKATDILNSRTKRANTDKFDEYRKDNLDRECGEEFCDYEEFSEAIEQTYPGDWEKFMRKNLKMNQKQILKSYLQNTDLQKTPQKWEIYREFKIDQRNLCPPTIKNSEIKQGLDIMQDPKEIASFYKVNTEGRLGRNGMNWQAYFRKLSTGKLQVLMNVTYENTTPEDLYHVMILKQFREEWDHVTPHRIMGLEHEYKRNGVSLNLMYEQKRLPIFGDIGVFWIHMLDNYPYRVNMKIGGRTKEVISWCIKSISHYCLETRCIKFPYFDKKLNQNLHQIEKDDHLVDDELCFYLWQEGKHTQLWSLAQGTPIVTLPDTALKLILPRELGKGHRMIQANLNSESTKMKLKAFCGKKNGLACSRHKLICGECDMCRKINLEDLVDKTTFWDGGKCERGITNL